MIWEFPISWIDFVVVAVEVFGNITNFKTHKYFGNSTPAVIYEAVVRPTMSIGDE